MDNLRETIRLPLLLEEQFQVQVETLNPKHEFTCKALDLSLGGMLLLAPPEMESLPRDADLVVHFTLPGDQLQWRLPARAVHCRITEAGCLCGVKFGRSEDPSMQARAQKALWNFSRDKQRRVASRMVAR